MHLVRTRMCQHVLRMYLYILDTDHYILVCTLCVPVQYILVCTLCVPVHTWMYHTEPCFTGFRGALLDANTQVPDVQQQHVHTGTYLVCTEYVQGHTKNDAVVLLLRRILYWLFHHILTASRKIAMMLPWKTVGLHGPSSSSAAT